ncbi:MAG: discoidin domain-containing protein [Chitinophagaceae bacterium]
MNKAMVSASLIVLLISFSFNPSLFAQSNPFPLNSSKEQVWKVKAQSDVANRADEISTGSFQTENWVQAIVPGTVFASYVAAGLEKDPNLGDNIYKVDKSKYDRNFWYRTEFLIPVSYTNGKIWLNFQGVNRKADIYLNSVRIGTLDGFMQRGQFDISGLVNRKNKNVLAVLIYMPKTPLANVGSPNYVSSAGWDWMPYVPGLNTGITDKVFLTNTGDITMRDPWVRTNLVTNGRADLTVSAELTNNSGKPVQAVLKGIINPGNIEFTQKVTIGANATENIVIDYKRFPQLVIHSPVLWWPNGYGNPDLYSCGISVLSDDQVSDQKKLQFGIKKYSYDTTGNVLHVSINGTRLFLKGGNWGMSEYMLRCRGAEYDTRVRFHKEMNFNIIRNWIGSTTDEEFYEACDKYGIMVWDDFWLNANPNLPADINVFNANAIEKIKRVRNHPSVAIYCADNEGWPEPPLSGWLNENIKTFDGERYYQANSHADNLTGSGPWMGLDPRRYFISAPVAIGGNKGWGLRTEIGTAVFTNFESFKKFMPEDKWWPRNEMWNQHFFGQLAFNAGPDQYDESIRTKYGQPTGIEEYCRKAQLLNIETNKAMYEGWQEHIWEDASGIMTWMSQSAYPSLVWQTYDYYYDLTGAFWGAKSACEPLHIQWNPSSNSVKVINTSGQQLTGLTASAVVYNLDGKAVNQYSQSATINSPANNAVQCFQIGFGQQKKNLALNKAVIASSSPNNQPAFITDGKPDTRWASSSRDDEWIYVDLGEEKVVDGVGLNWEDAYAKSYKIQTSTDAIRWTDVFRTDDGKTGEQIITFPEEKARYVRMYGIERGTYWGYSLWNFEVYEGNQKSENLSDVHFIKLQLKEKNGKLISDNFYWRGNNRTNFTALNSLPEVKLKVGTRITPLNGKHYITATITNPVSSPAIAFAIRVQAVKSKTGEQILPAVMSDNYFTLLKGESKEVRIEFESSLLGGDQIKLLVEPYNGISQGITKNGQK